MDEYGIAAFRSRQQVMKFEAILRRAGLGDAHVINTPREVAAGCGLSVQFPAASLPLVREALSRHRPPNLIGVYLAARQADGRIRLRAM